MAQLALIPAPNQGPMQFDGSTFDASQDGHRLTTQMNAVREMMLDGQWHSIPQIALHLRRAGMACTEPSISARIRDLRKARFGNYRVERRREPGSGLFLYRVAEAM